MSVTLIEVAPLTTWLFVSTTPVDDSTMPVPAEVAPWYPSVDTTSTSAGSTREAIWLVDSMVLETAVAVPAAPVFMLPISAPACGSAASAVPAVMASQRLWCERGGGGGTLP